MTGKIDYFDQVGRLRSSLLRARCLIVVRAIRRTTHTKPGRIRRASGCCEKQSGEKDRRSEH